MSKMRTVRRSVRAKRRRTVKATAATATSATVPFRFITPSELAKVERAGTDLDRLLAANIRGLAAHLTVAEVFVGKLRHALAIAVGIVSPPNAAAKIDDQAIDTFVELALELADDKAATMAYRTWARAQCAASLAADGGKPREYLVEVAREIMKLPAKDGAARALVKMDFERAMKASESIIESALLEEEKEEKEPA
jgi:hypothetical protein